MICHDTTHAVPEDYLSIAEPNKIVTTHIAILRNRIVEGYKGPVFSVCTSFRAHLTYINAQIEIETEEQGEAKTATG
jgi:hypothetical protein